MHYIIKLWGSLIETAFKYLWADLYDTAKVFFRVSCFDKRRLERRLEEDFLTFSVCGSCSVQHVASSSSLSCQTVARCRWVWTTRHKCHQRLRRLNHALVDLIKKHLMTLPKWRLLSHGRDCCSRRQQDDIITSLEWRCDVIRMTLWRHYNYVTTSTGRRYDVKAPSRQQWAVFMAS